ncbi:MAG: aminopeptidase, partial [Verrucomicrobiota bacterium]
MIDPRLTQLANNLVSYSTSLKAGEKVLIDAFDVPDEILVELIRATREKGASPYVNLNHARVTRELALEATDEQYRIHSAIELQRMKKMDAYIA